MDDQDAKPRTIIALWKANLEEPKFHRSDPTVMIADNSTSNFSMMITFYVSLINLCWSWCHVGFLVMSFWFWVLFLCSFTCLCFFCPVVVPVFPFWFSVFLSIPAPGSLFFFCVRSRLLCLSLCVFFQPPFSLRGHSQAFKARESRVHAFRNKACFVRDRGQRGSWFVGCVSC